jgi:anti-anti-sigma regulatory factor
MPTRHALPAELTIYVAAELRSHWMPWLADTGHDALEVAADAVAEVDAAGLQLLASLALALQRQGRELRLTGASATLIKACQELGLDDLLATAEVAS